MCAQHSDAACYSDIPDLVPLAGASHDDPLIHTDKSVYLGQAGVLTLEEIFFPPASVPTSPLTTGAAESLVPLTKLIQFYGLTPHPLL